MKSPLYRLADSLIAGLRHELDLTPKPGLVDRWNSGSHEDLTHAVMLQSIDLLEDYFTACASALEAGHHVERLRELGRGAEQRMQAELGTNTHRGAIFLGALLLAGVHRANTPDVRSVSRSIGQAAAELFSTRMPSGTHGAEVRARLGSGGIVEETLRGLPSLFRICLPALGAAGRLGWDTDTAFRLAMARLMVNVDDTTTLRRCGTLGAFLVRRDGARLEALIRQGDDPVPFLVQTDQRYRAIRLTMGGVADLLGMGIGWSIWQGQDSLSRPVRAAPAAISSTRAAPCTRES